MRVADFVIDFLIKNNINLTYCVTGRGSLFLNDALAKNKRTNLRSLFIIRKLKFKNSAIIRFVDFIGDINDFFLVRNIANNLFKKEKIEYIDFYAARLPNIIKKKIKFRIITSNDKNIIPDYFEPFEKKNVKIFYETSNNKIILFKADADQDRPRLQQEMKLIN